jgi:hypothetical protein
MGAIPHSDRGNDVSMMLTKVGGLIRMFVAGLETDIDRMKEGPHQPPYRVPSI